MLRRRNLLAVDGGGGLLPKEFQQVDWIGSVSDGPWFDTSYVPKAPFTFETDLSIDEFNGYVFGNGMTSPNTCAADLQPGSPGYLYYYNGSNRIDGRPNAPSRTFKHWIFGNQVLCEGVVVINTTLSLSNNNGSLTIFNHRGALTTGKIKRIVIKDNNGNTVRDLVPCYRKSDNIIGLYDVSGNMTNPFIINSGSGTPIKGEDII